jgi:hypothetical protein
VGQGAPDGDPVVIELALVVIGVGQILLAVECWRTRKALDREQWKRLASEQTLLGVIRSQHEFTKTVATSGRAVNEAQGRVNLYLDGRLKDLESAKGIGPVDFRGL